LFDSLHPSSSAADQVILQRPTNPQYQADIFPRDPVTEQTTEGSMDADQPTQPPQDHEMGSIDAVLAMSDQSFTEMLHQLSTDTIDWQADQPANPSSFPEQPGSPFSQAPAAAFPSPSSSFGGFDATASPGVAPEASFEDTIDPRLLSVVNDLAAGMPSPPNDQLSLPAPTAPEAMDVDPIVEPPPTVENLSPPPHALPESTAAEDTDAIDFTELINSIDAGELDDSFDFGPV
jgi:hypothetical protein